jgi:hypothetical protein
MFAFSRRTRFAISFGAFKIGEVKKDLLNDVSGFISQLQVLYRTNNNYNNFVLCLSRQNVVITFYLLRPHKLTNENQSQIQSVEFFLTYSWLQKKRELSE